VKLATEADPPSRAARASAGLPAFARARASGGLTAFALPAKADG